ncbi:MAG: hypothetical protein QM777_19420 [Pseudorhodoferax sp.]
MEPVASTRKTRSQPRAVLRRAGVQPQLQRAFLAAPQVAAALHAVAAGRHLVDVRLFGVERVRVQPDLAGAVGARPGRPALRRAHQHLGIGRRAALAVAHLQQMAHADVEGAVRHLGARAKGQVFGEVGVVVDHAGRHRARIALAPQHRRAARALRRRGGGRLRTVGRGGLGSGGRRRRRGRCRPRPRQRPGRSQLLAIAAARHLAHLRRPGAMGGARRAEVRARLQGREVRPGRRHRRLVCRLVCRLRPQVAPRRLGGAGREHELGTQQRRQGAVKAGNERLGHRWLRWLRCPVYGPAAAAGLRFTPHANPMRAAAP